MEATAVEGKWDGLADGRAGGDPGGEFVDPREHPVDGLEFSALLAECTSGRCFGDSDDGKRAGGSRGGIPMKSPRWVPWNVLRVITSSPSASC